MLLPASYDEWKKCIVHECGITLTTEYIDSRVAALKNLEDPATRQFIHLYGIAHHTNVISWFETARGALAIER